MRYAWHASGTYDRHTRTGGSNGGTMRFETERADPENAGFSKAHALAVKALFPALSMADIIILAGHVAIEHTGGPAVPFSYGRRDFGGCAASASMAEKESPTIDAMRGTFDRLGFDDKETVALIVLGHQYGRCHGDASGFEGAWREGLGYPSAYTHGVARGGYRLSPGVLAARNQRQYEMDFGGGEPFMMLVSDMCLWYDEEYRRHLLHYDSHRSEFRRDAALAWKKLTELGCAGTLVPERETKAA
uniref:Plant heme peroxidase family profile domain-containing protein n=1 Tax=Emiliania huxleyi (strain CCMP1516) TaxID=280463 RepID=A0A0D3KYZ8_EMIH1